MKASRGSRSKLRKTSAKDPKQTGTPKISNYFFYNNASSSTCGIAQSKTQNETSEIGVSQLTSQSQGKKLSRSSSRSHTKSFTVPTAEVSDDSDIEFITHESDTSNADVKICHKQNTKKPSDDIAKTFSHITKTKKNESCEEKTSPFLIQNPEKPRISKRLSLKRKTSNSDVDKNIVFRGPEKVLKTVISDQCQVSLPSATHSKCDEPLMVKSEPNLQAATSSKFECNDDSQTDDLQENQSSSASHVPLELNQGNDVMKTKIDDITNRHDAEDQEADDPQDSSTHFRIPYYIQNFESILNAVMENENFSCLFNEEDLKVINGFSKLSDGGKRLYVRMFSRKLKWIPLNKLNYNEIAEDLNPYLKELVDLHFIDCEDKLNDLMDVLRSLPAGDIKALAKSYHISTKITQKKNLLQELIKKTQQTSISSMFGSKGGGVSTAMLKSAKEKLKGVYKLRLDPRSVFVRVMMLFSVVNTSGDEDSGSGGQQQLFQMLMVNMGKVVFPSYEVIKTCKIFKNREDVIRFEQALQVEFDLLTYIEKGNWSTAYEFHQKVIEQVDVLENDKEIVEWNANLPDYLRCFTATSVLYRLLSVGIDIIQRRKDFEEAVKLLWKLLSQTTYCSTHRGYWWERLALNLDVHLKKIKQSLDVIQKGLADEHVKVGHRLALFQRAESICQRPHLKLQNCLKDFHHEPVREMPKVFIEGRVLHQGVLTSGLRFLTEGSYTNGNAHDMTVCGVEEFVQDYYKKNGFPSSVHAEGSIVSSLFCLFFWDILFASIPDAFHSPYQAMPLDLYTESFYLRRKDAIDERIQELEESSIEALLERMEETWSNHHGVMCVGMSWDRVKSLDEMKDLVSCVGGKWLSGIVRRYAKCPRHTRSGFPDLTLWNTHTRAFKICEVKGPGDKLSHKQILWIDYLMSLGIDAEVCHVKAVAAKKLKPA